MKNEGIFPLERNNYFFGKLMTEREYDAEQAYFNNKRRLLNIALTKPGVVCGLTVIKTDGATIAVESGLAIDGLGRELAVPELIVKLLSELDGFVDDVGHKPYVYLCAEYSETPVEPMRALSGGTGGTQFGRVRETVRMFLRYGEPEPFEYEFLNAEACRTENLEDKLERGAKMLLFLARIHLVRWEEAYEINEIEQVPFGQYASVVTLPEKQYTDENREAERVAADITEYNHRPALPVTAYGTAEVRIPEDAKPDSVYYSVDIPHNLGPVPVALTLGLSTGGNSVFGDASIFDEAFSFDYAARVSNENGTFKIGVRVYERVSAQTLSFVWSAAIDPARAGTEAAETPRITLSPSTARIKPMTLLRITAEFHGISDGEVNWSVREPDGGNITRDGMYIAPSEPGVYTVVARCGAVSEAVMIVVQ